MHRASVSAVTCACAWGGAPACHIMRTTRSHTQMPCMPPAARVARKCCQCHADVDVPRVLAARRARPAGLSVTAPLGCCGAAPTRTVLPLWAFPEAAPSCGPRPGLYDDDETEWAILLLLHACSVLEECHPTGSPPASGACLCLRDVPNVRPLSLLCCCCVVALPTCFLSSNDAGRQIGTRARRRHPAPRSGPHACWPQSKPISARSSSSTALSRPWCIGVRSLVTRGRRSSRVAPSSAAARTGSVSGAAGAAARPFLGCSPCSEPRGFLAPYLPPLESRQRRRDVAVPPGIFARVPRAQGVRGAAPVREQHRGRAEPVLAVWHHPQLPSHHGARWAQQGLRNDPLLLLGRSGAGRRVGERDDSPRRKQAARRQVRRPAQARRGAHRGHSAQEALRRAGEPGGGASRRWGRRETRRASRRTNAQGPPARNAPCKPAGAQPCQRSHQPQRAAAPGSKAARSTPRGRSERPARYSQHSSAPLLQALRLPSSAEWWCFISESPQPPRRWPLQPRPERRSRTSGRATLAPSERSSSLAAAQPQQQHLPHPHPCALGPSAPPTHLLPCAQTVCAARVRPEPHATCRHHAAHPGAMVSARIASAPHACTRAHARLPHAGWAKMLARTRTRPPARPPAQIPSNSTDDLLRSLFAPYGNVVEVHLLKKGVGSGCGFVTYDRCAPPRTRRPVAFTCPGASAALLPRRRNGGPGWGTTRDGPPCFAGAWGVGCRGRRRLMGAPRFCFLRSCRRQVGVV